MNKFQVFFCDVEGNYNFANFLHLNESVSFFRRAISKSECLICDLRMCGDLECIATYRNYKHLKIKGV